MDKIKCNFCGNLISQGTGIMFVKNDGSVYYFCSSKCEKNFRLGKNRKKLKWTRH